MGVFGQIGGALKAPVKAVNKAPGMGAVKKAVNPGMNALAKAGGAVGGMMGNKMGLGPSKPPIPSIPSPVNQPQGMQPEQSPVMMGAGGPPRQAVNAPTGMYGGMTPDYSGGPPQAMNTPQQMGMYQRDPGFTGPTQATQDNSPYVGMGQGPQEATGIGPSPQMMGMNRRRQMM